jgi:hypothetical protein
MTDDKVQFVIDAVYAIAHALQVGLNGTGAFVDMQTMKQDVCPDDSIETNWISRKAPTPDVCTAMRTIDGTDFYQKYLLKVNFESESRC